MAKWHKHHFFYFVSYITPLFWERFLYVFTCFLSLSNENKKAVLRGTTFSIWQVSGLLISFLPHRVSTIAIVHYFVKTGVRKRGFRNHFSWEEIYIWSLFLSHVQQSVSVPMSDETTSPFKLLLALLFVHFMQ